MRHRELLSNARDEVDSLLDTTRNVENSLSDVVEYLNDYENIVLDINDFLREIKEFLPKNKQEELENILDDIVDHL